MADKASKKPKLFLPTRSEPKDPGAIEPSSSVPQSTNTQSKPPAAETWSPAAGKVNSLNTEEKARDWPSGMAVDREKDGLATGLFCPVCFGDLFQYLVSEERGFVMCPNHKCPYPFDRSREELQEHFTLVPKFIFGGKPQGNEEGKGKKPEEKN